MLTLAAALVLAAAPGDSVPVPHYDIQIRMEPAAHRITVRARIEGWTCGEEHRLYLNRALRLDTLRLGGTIVPVTFDTAAAPAPWTTATRPLAFSCGAGPVELVYGGEIADTTSEVNMIAADLVEIASYIGWYPRDHTIPLFTYRTELVLPAGWGVAHGGREEARSESGGWQRVTWVSAAPVMDLPIVAAPDLVVERAERAGAAIEAYAASRHRALARDAIEYVGDALERYEAWFGAAGGAAEPLPTRFVYSPRLGWGYSRLPLIVSGGERVARAASRPFVVPLIYRGVAHEAAHFWWSLADSRTPHDWINEALAEFSAFSASVQRFGAETRDSMVAEYRRSSADADSSFAVAATPAESRLRYVNHYERTTLLLAAIEREVGSDRLHDFLRAFHAEWCGRRAATTADFLTSARQHLGEAAARRLERCTMQPWSRACEQ